MAPWPKPLAMQSATAMRCVKTTGAASFAACETERSFGCARVALVAAATEVKHCEAEELSDGGARTVSPWLRLSILGKVTGGTHRGGTTTLVALDWRSGAAVRVCTAAQPTRCVRRHPWRSGGSLDGPRRDGRTWYPRVWACEGWRTASAGDALRATLRFAASAAGREGVNENESPV
eukprot:5219969-Pleurochrysis_carterae.AAC.3